GKGNARIRGDSGHVASVCHRRDRRETTLDLDHVGDPKGLMLGAQSIQRRENRRLRRPRGVTQPAKDPGSLLGLGRQLLGTGEIGLIAQENQKVRLSQRRPGDHPGIHLGLPGGWRHRCGRRPRSPRSQEHAGNENAADRNNPPGIHGSFSRGYWKCRQPSRASLSWSPSRVPTVPYNPPPRMKVHEYQAKSILARYGVAVPRGEVTDNPADAREIAT